MVSEVTTIQLEGRGIRVLRLCDDRPVFIRRLTLHDGRVEWVEGMFTRATLVRDGRGGLVNRYQLMNWDGYPEHLREARELARFIERAVGMQAAEQFRQRVNGGRG